ncbi:twin-arginine translocase subunit TatC [Sphingomonas bacterium]|uniref:twin-arginine translocase subunit TatC n=1 Tax=Sphingomonas bacterium TaxID=1895847 RepID=UPI0015765825|nr:twin-arginine translocase subunit TatC [Sphingomonas bacterium]
MSDELDASRAPLLDHLVELRRRLLYSAGALVLAFAISLYFARPILTLLVRPLRAAGQLVLINTDVYGGFMVQVKVAFFTAVMVSFPVTANQVWRFVAPGLYRQERRALLPFLLATPILFTMGAALAYFFVIPPALHFLFSFQGDLGGVTQRAFPDVSSYLKVVMQFLFGFGFAFLMPVLLMLLERAGIVTREQLVGLRRYAIVANFAVAALLTPPDPWSMMMLALPLVVLYEFALIGIRLTERSRAREAARALVES